MTAYLKLHHFCHKPARTEDNLNVHIAVCWHQSLQRLNQKSSAGLCHADLILKVNGNIAGQADALGVGFANCALAEADSPWEPGLSDHGVCMDWNQEI